MSRREALSRIALAAASGTLACELGPSPPPSIDNNTGRLTARPRTSGNLPAPGLSSLVLSAGRDGVLYVPSGLSPDAALPVILLLHGAGGSGRGIVTALQGVADEAGVVLLAPDSRGPTWDAIHGSYGADVVFINAALEAVFSRYPVDPQRLGIAGFSDGATYSLALGRTNGDLFRRIVAFSPGFLAPASQVERPPLYITHGTHDTVLPIDLTSREIVEVLSGSGYHITFREFDGGHWIPAAYAPEALRWVTGGALDPEEPPAEPPSVAMLVR